MRRSRPATCCVACSKARAGSAIRPGARRRLGGPGSRKRAPAWARRRSRRSTGPSSRRSPRATRHTPGAWYRDWRVMSLDATTLDVSDTPAQLGRYSTSEVTREQRWTLRLRCLGQPPPSRPCCPPRQLRQTTRTPLRIPVVSAAALSSLVQALPLAAGMQAEIDLFYPLPATRGNVRTTVRVVVAGPPGDATTYWIEKSTSTLLQVAQRTQSSRVARV